MELAAGPGMEPTVKGTTIAKVQLLESLLEQHGWHHCTFAMGGITARHRRQLDR
jgi:hypothetical protein